MKIKKRFSVLYAEDNEDSGLMMSTLLGFSDIDVSLVGSIKEAFLSAQNSQFDLYLLDSKFPEGSGLDLCRQLHEFDPQTPIVFYSGNAYENDQQMGIAAGANAYIVKPHLDKIAPMILDLVGRTPETAAPELHLPGAFAFSVIPVL